MCSVLLIDDEVVVREIGSEMLQAMAIRCITADCGETGIRLYNENKDIVKLVILDVEMPGISGDKVFDILKGMNPELQILITSGYSKNHLEKMYFKRKLDNVLFMPKPFQFTQLSHHVRMMLEKTEYAMNGSNSLN